MSWLISFIGIKLGGNFTSPHSPERGLDGSLTLALSNVVEPIWLNQQPWELEQSFEIWSGKVPCTWKSQEARSEGHILILSLVAPHLQIRTRVVIKL